MVIAAGVDCMAGLLSVVVWAVAALSSFQPVDEQPAMVRTMGFGGFKAAGAASAVEGRSGLGPRHAAQSTTAVNAIARFMGFPPGMPDWRPHPPPFISR